jgi:D-arabinose 5-phosphate isomerase GutQ
MDAEMGRSLEREAGLQLARKILQQEAETIRELAASRLDEAFWNCAVRLAECPGLIWVTAVGTSAAVGARFAHILTGSGARSMFLPPSDGLHGHTGIIQAQDILVAMSRGGESAEVNQMVAIANDRQAVTIAMVHNTASPLAKCSRLVLPVPSPQEYELMGLLATTSSVAFSAMGDGLCAIVLEMKGYSPEEFKRTHPGGAVGRAAHNTGAL